MLFYSERQVVRNAVNPQIAALAQKLCQMEEKLELLFATQRAQRAFAVRERAVRFEECLLQRYRQIRTRLARCLRNTLPLLEVRRLRRRRKLPRGTRGTARRVA
jgi:hypothetical protein